MEYKVNYEPYFVMKMSSAIPPFWEHFTGFGRNKISWVEEVAIRGYRFYVSPDSFLIHINHDYSKQDVQVVRPFIIDEYAHRFQVYLKNKYGKSLWEGDALSHWIQQKTLTYVN